MLSTILASLALSQAPLDDPAQAFGTLPLLNDLQVSPDGQTFAALVRTTEAQGLGVFTVDGGVEYKTFIRDDGNRKLRKFFWKSPDRLVFSISLPASRQGTRTTETRLFSYSIAENKAGPILEAARPKGESQVQIQDDIVSILPKDPGFVLAQYWARGGDGYSTYKVNVEKNRVPRLVQKTIDHSIDFQADLAGEVRSSFGLRNETQRRLSFRLPSGRWKNFSHRVADDAPSFSVAGFPNDRRYAYVLSDHQTPTRALYLFDIENDAFEEQLFAHPISDVYGIRQDPETGKAIGAVFGEDDAIVTWFGDTKPRKTVKAVKAAMEYESMSFVDYNLNQSVAVLFASSGNRPGRYITFDYGEGTIFELPPQYPALEGIKLGEVIATSYTARDGLNIPAFVTLPPGIDTLTDAKKLPFIVLPHGGPTARDFAGFDWLPQFLAYRGFGVLQMNFRGSSGYGAEFENAGDRQWGQAMQDDITDGARWLFENGYADQAKTSILGASYGGYAALMGAVKEPDLFRCAVSINGVTDLPKVITDARRYIGGEIGTRHIGRLWKDRKMLRENSPVQRVDAIKTPILLIASEDDRVVPKEHSIAMRRRLERAGKDVTYVMLPEGSHFLDVGNNRITTLRTIDQFMTRCR